MAYIKEHNCKITEKTTFSIEQNIGGKMHKFHTSNYGLDWNTTTYKFRTVSKCRAGFMTISDHETTLEQVVNNWKKNALQTIEVQLPGSDFYVTVLALKGNKFVIAENTILENIKIGTIHSSYPKMADHRHWKNIGSKTWADNAYKLEDSFKNMTIEIVE
tara:strand:- start:146 stop:625 length:480 start_codon:yes stop_codon:yes gene_type:complete